MLTLEYSCLMLLLVSSGTQFLQAPRALFPGTFEHKRGACMQLTTLHNSSQLDVIISIWQHLHVAEHSGNSCASPSRSLGFHTLSHYPEGCLMAAGKGAAQSLTSMSHLLCFHLSACKNCGGGCRLPQSHLA